MKKIFVFIYCICTLLMISDVYAETARLDEIVVTATRTEEEIDKIPANVTVITREDIEKSTATTVQDLLRNEEGLVIRDLFGTGTQSTVDMRGFGLGKNTLILLDGRRLNEIDSGSPDWNLIPLENVERIEVVRGNGSVLYGDNAMVGVINIITKKGKAMKPEAEIETRIESFNGDTEHFSLRGGTDKVNYFIFAKQCEAEGYRDNSEFNANDIDAKIGLNISEKIYVDFSGKYHNDQQGYPGSLTENQLKSDRTQTITPDDGVDYEQHFYGIDFRYTPGTWGDFSIGYNFNNRKFDANFSGYKGKRDTDTDEIKLKYTATTTFFNYKNLLIIGVDRYIANVDNVTSNISKEESGYYMGEEFFFSDKLSFNIGYRYTEAEIKDTVNGDQNFNESAVKTGITYNYKKDSKGFISYSRGYRLPTTDELSWTNVKLKPELADTYEGGIVHSFNEKLETRLTLYAMNIDHELYFNPSTFYNENFEKTKHQGTELGISSVLSDSISLFGNWTYNRATIESGLNEGKIIPLIPLQSANFGGNLKFYRNYLMTIEGNWVGERFFDNDFPNEENKLPDYITFDTKLSYENKGINIYLGINNIFDKEYSEYGITSAGNKYLYPSPERNYYGGIKVSF